ncbi:MAG: ABC transporter permease [Christensenellales bacterium]
MEGSNIKNSGYKKERRIKVSDYVVFFSLIGLCVILSLASDVFLSAGNISNIFLQASLNGVIAIGMTMVILTGGIDLSVGSIVAVAGIFIGIAKDTMPPVVVMIIALIAATLLGFINGIGVTKGKLPPFIATLGMMSIARGLASVLSNGRPIGNIPELFRFIGGGRIFGIFFPIIVMVVAYIIAYFLLKYTKLGRNTYAVGGNMEAAKLSGINVHRTQLKVYSISGLCSGIAAIMLVGRLNSASPTAGLEYEMNAIAATVIGGASMSGGEGRIQGTFIGALIISVLRNGLNLLNVSSYWQQIAIGLVIVVSVLADTLRRNR